MRKILLLAILITGCGGEIYYLDSYNYNQLGDSTYETKQLESPELEGASIEAYEFIANEIISAYSRSLALDNSLGGVDNEIKALEFLNQAMYNLRVFQSLWLPIAMITLWGLFFIIFWNFFS